MENTKTIFVSIVGKPNVGKSSLLNNILGQKVSIVTNKPQTTRMRITGIFTRDNLQIVFIDTPGVHIPVTKLSNHMLKSISESINNVDVSVLLIDAKSKTNKAEQELLSQIKKRKQRAILAINKIDLLKNKAILIPLIQEYSKLHEFEAIIPISVLKNDGVEILLEEISKLSVESPHFFPDDTITDQSEKLIVSEILREKILINLQQEIPHSVAIVVEKMNVRESKNIIDIDCNIFCERKSHKGIIIGKHGEMLKKIATSARLELEQFFACKINLQCWVKIKDEWRNKERDIKMFGLNC